MKFGEKVRKLRTENGMTQRELAERAGVSLRTVISYEKGDSYPKDRQVYSRLAEIFTVDVNYLLAENEWFVTQASEIYGYRGQQQARRLIEDAAGLFAGGELDEEDKDAIMQALMTAYWDAKKENKKYSKT